MSNDRDLIHDLARVLDGALRPSAELGPPARLAAARLQDALGITPGELTAGIEDRLRMALAPETLDVPEHDSHTAGGPRTCTRCQMIRDNADWLALPAGRVQTGPDRVRFLGVGRRERASAAISSLRARLTEQEKHLELSGDQVREHLRHDHRVPRLVDQATPAGLQSLHRARHAHDEDES